MMPTRDSSGPKEKSQILQSLDFGFWDEKNSVAKVAYYGLLGATAVACVGAIVAVSVLTAGIAPAVAGGAVGVGLLAGHVGLGIGAVSVGSAIVATIAATAIGSKLQSRNLWPFKKKIRTPQDKAEALSLIANRDIEESWKLADKAARLAQKTYYTSLNNLPANDSSLATLKENARAANQSADAIFNSLVISKIYNVHVNHKNHATAVAAIIATNPNLKNLVDKIPYKASLIDAHPPVDKIDPLIKQAREQAQKAINVADNSRQIMVANINLPENASQKASFLSTERLFKFLGVTKTSSQVYKANEEPSPVEQIALRAKLEKLAAVERKPRKEIYTEQEIEARQNPRQRLT